MAIINDNKEISAIYKGSKSIATVYQGVKLIWELIRSCFGKGIWINNYPWNNNDGWKNNTK
jgi:hypothetical protein